MRKKIKVLHIIKSLGKGGAEILLPETLQFHNKEIFEFHYIYFLPWKNDVVKEIEKKGGIVHCLNIKSNIGILLKSALKIRKYCKENNINIIHLHSPLVAVPIRIFKSFFKIPICYTEHNLINKYNIYTKNLNYITYNSQDYVIACSKPAKEAIKKHVKHLRVPIIEISNGINTEKFKPNYSLDIREELNIPSNAIVVLVIAVLRKQKRLDLWLETINKAIDKNKNIYGIIVGGGPLEEELISQHKKLKNANHIHLVGKQLNVKPYLDTSDIFMMTSEFEGLPISLLEAMSNELAIVSTNVGGINNVIRNKKDGFTTDINSPEKLSIYIENLARDKNLLEQFKKNARKRVVEEFSINKMTNQLENLYLKIYNENREV